MNNEEEEKVNNEEKVMSDVEFNKLRFSQFFDEEMYSLNASIDSLVDMGPHMEVVSSTDLANGELGFACKVKVISKTDKKRRKTKIRYLFMYRYGGVSEHLVEFITTMKEAVKSKSKELKEYVKVVLPIGRVKYHDKWCLVYHWINDDGTICEDIQLLKDWIDLIHESGYQHLDISLRNIVVFKTKPFLFGYGLVCKVGSITSLPLPKDCCATGSIEHHPISSNADDYALNRVTSFLYKETSRQATIKAYNRFREDPHPSSEFVPTDSYVDDTNIDEANSVDANSDVGNSDISCDAFENFSVIPIENKYNESNTKQMATLTVKNINKNRRPSTSSEDEKIESAIEKSSTDIINLHAVAFSDKHVDILTKKIKQKNNHTEEINLSNNHIENAVYVIFEALTHENNRVKYMNLASNSISDTQCDFIGKWLKTNKYKLERLDLSNNNITSKGIDHIINGIVSPGCTLQYLELKDHTINDYNLPHVLDIFYHKLKNSFKRIMLHNNEITDSSVNIILGAMKVSANNGNKIFLNISGSKLSKGAKAKIKEQCGQYCHV